MGVQLRNIGPRLQLWDKPEDTKFEPGSEAVHSGNVSEVHRKKTVVTESPELVAFCQDTARKYGSPEAIKAGVLAKEFAARFLVSSRPSILEFHLLGAQLGIDLQASSIMPAAVFKAFHQLSHQSGRYELTYPEEQWTGTSEFHIAHDLYEILQEIFEALYPEYIAPRHPQKPTCMAPRANTFAAALVMNEEVMFNAIFKTGFDVVGLRHHFNKAYIAVAKRVIDVLRDRDDPHPEVLFAVYEPKISQNEDKLEDPFLPELFQAKWVGHTEGILVSPKRSTIRAPRYPRHLLPGFGDHVLPGSIVDTVIKSGRPVYLERITGFDLWGDNDLTCLTVPVIWRPQNGLGPVVAKVIEVIMPYIQAHLLAPQLNKLSSDRIPERYQFI